MSRLPLIIVLLLLHACCLAQNAAENPLFNTFKQNTVKGDDNNNTVAVIKSAIGTFGVNNVFRYVHTDEVARKYSVRLRSEERLALTYAELEEAAAHCNLPGKAQDMLSADIRRYAIFCFAVMAKKLQLQQPALSYRSAINTLNHTYDLAAASALLGLRLKPLKPCTIGNLSGYNHIIVCNAFYTAYANSGYYDESNSPTGIASLSDFKQNHSSGGCFFGRCNINEAFRIDE